MDRHYFLQKILKNTEIKSRPQIRFLENFKEYCRRILPAISIWSIRQSLSNLGTFLPSILIHVITKNIFIITKQFCVCRRVSVQRKLNNERHSHNIDVSFDLKELERRKRTVNCIIPKINQNMNIHVFKNTGYIVLHLNSVLVMFSTVLVYVHFGAYAMSIGYDDTTAATLFSTMGISNFIGRFVFGGLGHVNGLSAIGLYTGGFLVSAIIIVLIPCAKTFISLVCCAAGFGLATACNGSKMPQVMSDAICAEHYMIFRLKSVKSTL